MGHKGGVSRGPQVEEKQSVPKGSGYTLGIVGRQGVEATSGSVVQEWEIGW